MCKILGKLSSDKTQGFLQPYAGALFGLWGYKIFLSLLLLLFPRKRAKPNTKSSADDILALFSTLGLTGMGIAACGVWGCMLVFSNPVN